MDEKDFAELMADEQASRLAQGLVLEALIDTHPHPLSLRSAWDRLVAAQQVKALDMRVNRPETSLVTDALQYQLERWTAKILRHAPRDG